LGALFLGNEYYDAIAPDFDATKREIIEWSYERTKDELRNAQPLIRELAEIKVSKFWLLKERLKKLLGR
jgi:hypothetical protein